MKKLPIALLLFEALLIVGLVRGLLLFRDPEAPRIAMFVGLGVNLLLQWAVITAIRKHRSAEELTPLQKSEAADRQREVWKLIFISAGCFALVLMFNVGLFISHKYSSRTFATVALIASASMFAFLVSRLSRLQKPRG